MGSISKKLQKITNKLKNQFDILQKHVNDTGENIDVVELVKEKTKQSLEFYKKTRNKRKAFRKSII